eukprot:8701530-Heterocapsa_arctica.AAC.1
MKEGAVVGTNPFPLLAAGTVNVWIKEGREEIGSSAIRPTDLAARRCLADSRDLRVAQRAKLRLTAADGATLRGDACAEKRPRVLKVVQCCSAV